MPRTSKTSNVLKLLNLPDAGQVIPESVETFFEVAPPEPDKPDIIAEKPASRRRRPRKAIVKHINLEKLTESAVENPAIKPASAEERDKIYVRTRNDERQIINVPLMLINEQIGTAVERFNSCACDACLRGITDAALDLMRPMYVRVVNSFDEDEVNRLIKEHRPEAIRTLARACIAANMKPYHDF